MKLISEEVAFPEYIVEEKNGKKDYKVVVSSYNLTLRIEMAEFTRTIF